MKFLQGNLPIGIDLGTGSLKLAQMRIPTQKVFELGAAAWAQFPAETDGNLQQRVAYAAGVINEKLKDKRFRGRHCVLGLPACHVSVQHVKLPMLPPAQTQAAIRQELAQKLPYSVNDAVIRHTLVGDIIGDGERRQEFIVAAVERGTLETYLDIARLAKLELVGVNVECAALVECFSRLFRRASDATRPILFIDMGLCSTQVVLTHGDKLVFARNLLHGERQIDQAVAEGLHITPQQAHDLRWNFQPTNPFQATQERIYKSIDPSLDMLADEAMQCLRYYDSVFRNMPVERVIFLGGQAHDKHLCQSFAQRLNLPAQIGDPLMRVQNVEQSGIELPAVNESGQREPQPKWAVAIGLSLGAPKAA